MTDGADIEQVDLALAKTAKKIVRQGPGRWEFTLANGSRFKGTAQWDEGWLLLDAALGDGKSKDSADRVWDLLRSGAGLPGGAKFALDLRRRARVRAEIPLDDGLELARVAEAFRGFKSAAKRFATRKKLFAHSRAPKNSETANSDGKLCNLRQLCDEAAWAYVARADGRLAVQLDVPDRFHQAMIERRGQVQSVGGGGHIATTLDVSGSAPAACRQAVGLLLLTANMSLRMVRAVAADKDGQLTPRFEVVLASCPSAAELARALDALSVACRLCANEVSALQDDETTANEFLAARGWSS